MDQKTAVLLAGYGGPTSMAEVRPFIQSALEGLRIPEVRFDEVLRHYEAFNGVSPYNSISYKQQQALKNWFEKKGLSPAVYVGFRHTSPTFQEVFQDLIKEGVEKVIVFVLSSFRCPASFEKYVKKIKEAQVLTAAGSIAVEYTENFYKHPLFLAAQADRVRLLMNNLPKQELDKTFFLFSAHSIPVPMSDESGYASQFTEASDLVAKALGISHWGRGYQSRSGDPRDPWLSPDVKAEIERLDKTRFKNIIIIPIGFLCDHVEVLYDLDVDVKKTTEAHGLKYLRASTVADHPKFIEMIGDLCASR